MPETTKIILEAENRTGAAFRQATTDMRRMEQQAGAFGGAGSRAMNQASTAAVAFGGSVSKSFLGWAAALMTVDKAISVTKDAIKTYGEVEKALFRVGQRAGYSGGELRKFEDETRNSARASHRSAADYAEGMDMLRKSTGLTMDEVKKLAPIVSKGAKAAHVEFRDMAAGVGAGIRQLNLQFKDVPLFMDQLTHSANRGLEGVEQYLPRLTGMMQALNIQGPVAAQTMLSILTVSAKAQGSTAGAVEQFERMLDTIAKSNIGDPLRPLQNRMREAVKAGIDPLQVLMEELQNFKPEVLARLFGGRSAQYVFVSQLRQRLGEVKGEFGDLGKASGTVARQLNDDEKRVEKAYKRLDKSIADATTSWGRFWASTGVPQGTAKAAAGVFEEIAVRLDRVTDSLSKARKASEDAAKAEENKPETAKEQQLRLENERRRREQPGIDLPPTLPRPRPSLAPTTEFPALQMRPPSGAPQAPRVPYNPRVRLTPTAPAAPAPVTPSTRRRRSSEGGGESTRGIDLDGGGDGDAIPENAQPTSGTLPPGVSFDGGLDSTTTAKIGEWGAYGAAAATKYGAQAAGLTRLAAAAGGLTTALNATTPVFMHMARMQLIEDAKKSGGKIPQGSMGDAWGGFSWLYDKFKQPPEAEPKDDEIAALRANTDQLRDLNDVLDGGGGDGSDGDGGGRGIGRGGGIGRRGGGIGRPGMGVGSPGDGSGSSAPGASSAPGGSQDLPGGTTAPGGTTDSTGSVPPGTGGTGSNALDQALTMEGKHEVANNDEIKQYLRTGGVGMDPAKTAWCAAFVNASLNKVGAKGSGSQVATAFLKWGEAVKGDPQRGDVLVQSRGRAAGQTGGHVGFATGETRMKNGVLQYRMFAGNSGNKASFKWYNASEVTARRGTAAEGFKPPTGAPPPQATGGEQPPQAQGPGVAPDTQSPTTKATWFHTGAPIQGPGGRPWYDPSGQREGKQASGLPATTPGIATPGRTGLREWYQVTLPDGRTVITQKTDVGPGKGPQSKGIGLDVNAALAKDLYPGGPATFPSGQSGFRVKRIGKNLPPGVTPGIQGAPGPTTAPPTAAAPAQAPAAAARAHPSSTDENQAATATQVGDNEFVQGETQAKQIRADLEKPIKLNIEAPSPGNRWAQRLRRPHLRAMQNRELNEERTKSYADMEE